MKKIIITGNVGREPQIKTDRTNSDMAFFSVGVSVGTKQNPKTDWVEIICNNKLADIAKNFIKKGSFLLIEGFPITDAYINKENKAISVLKIIANNIEFLNKGDMNSSKYEVDRGLPL